jgi:hypothetical protein
VYFSKMAGLPLVCNRLPHILVVGSSEHANSNHCHQYV